MKVPKIIAPQVDQVNSYLSQHPKKVFLAGMGLLILSFALSLVQHFSSRNTLERAEVPKEASVQVPSGEREKLSQKTKETEMLSLELKMERIVKELTLYEKKNLAEHLTPIDSQQIQNLLYEYQNLSDELASY